MFKKLFQLFSAKTPQQTARAQNPKGTTGSALPQLLTHPTDSGFFAQPAKRSVLFYHNSYYHFHYLAQALRRRGWDALTVSLEDPEGPNALYYHGEDLNLFSRDHGTLYRNIDTLYEMAKQRYPLFHFANDGVMSFFPKYYDHPDPPDIVAWKQLGNKVAYTMSGCNSATAKSSVTQWSTTGHGESVCDTCAWQDRPDVCRDEKNLAWAYKVETYCDIIFGEALPALDAMALPKAFREPTTMCLDPLVWHPDLEIPSEWRLPRQPGELFVYHAVGNYESRTQGERNIKGTGAVLQAIERLQAEGFPVRLIFKTDVPNKEIRFIQAQADVIVDQLNYGRYGATAREGMMLGKPTLCYLNQHEPSPEQELACMQEVPLVSADEQTLYTELKALLLDADGRHAISQASRQYALKWHSADGCAHRYEQIYDALMQSGKVDSYPSSWVYYEPIPHVATQAIPVTA